MVFALFSSADFDRIGHPEVTGEQPELRQSGFEWRQRRGRRSAAGHFDDDSPQDFHAVRVDAAHVAGKQPTKAGSVGPESVLHAAGETAAGVAGGRLQWTV